MRVRTTNLMIDDTDRTNSRITQRDSEQRESENSELNKINNNYNVRVRTVNLIKYTINIT